MSNNTGGRRNRRTIRDELCGSPSNNEYTSNSLPTSEELDKFTRMRGVQAEVMAVQQYQKEKRELQRQHAEKRNEKQQQLSIMRSLIFGYGESHPTHPISQPNLAQKAGLPSNQNEAPHSFPCGAMNSVAGIVSQASGTARAPSTPSRLNEFSGPTCYSSQHSSLKKKTHLTQPQIDSIFHQETESLPGKQIHIEQLRAEAYAETSVEQCGLCKALPFYQNWVTKGSKFDQLAFNDTKYMDGNVTVKINKVPDISGKSCPIGWARDPIGGRQLISKCLRCRVCPRFGNGCHFRQRPKAPRRGKLRYSTGGTVPLLKIKTCPIHGVKLDRITCYAVMFQIWQYCLRDICHPKMILFEVHITVPE